MNSVNQLLLDFDHTSIPSKVLIVLVITLGVSLVLGMVVRGLKRKSEASKTHWDNAFAFSVGAPLRLIIWVVGLGLAVDFSGLDQDGSVRKAILACRDVGVIVSIAWFLLRFINLAQANIVRQQTDSGKKVDESAVAGMGKLLRLAVFISAGLVSLQTLGFSIAGVLTFGGIGGIAIGFAAKEMLANFFGGLMLYLDRPFKVGDWVRSPDREIEGTVEEIGWRITRIRNFDSRPLYVPNSSFLTISIENVSRMTNRRINETIGIRYDDSSAINSIVSQVTDYLKSHDGIDQDQTIMVSFTTFAPSSLDFFVYCFTKTQSGPTFYKIKQEIMLHVLSIINENGAECAYPTTTVHLQGGGKTPNSSAAPTTDSNV